MNTLTLSSHPDVARVFNGYPKEIKLKMEALRSLVLETANEIDEITHLEETLKWNEPSYLTKHGSTLRMDWKAKNPEYYAMYFKCTSKLIPTFKASFANVFEFEGNRAIVFKLGDSIPNTELKACIKVALRYHKVKHLPNLGIIKK